MYLEYYGLKEAPFSITPDPRYVFLSDRHREALAHLLYGVGKGGGSGFVQLTGEVGTGKTTLCRLLLEQLPEDTRVALILNPKLSPLELLVAVCEELGIDVVARKGSQKDLVDALNAYLLDAYAQGLRVVLIVDEAQELSVESLEQIRLLTNLETPTQKLLQIILLGQPELRDLLAKPELRQLAQRITARYHLEPLDAEETAAYVRHRIEVAGLERMPFTRLGLNALYQRSGGIPRVINIIADRAMTAGFALEEDKLGERVVQRAADEALPGRMRHWWRRTWPWLLALFMLLVLFMGGYAWWQHRHATRATTVSQNSAADVPARNRSLQQALQASPDNGADAAWSKLLARWQVDSDEATVKQARSCPQVIAPGLDCLRGTGTLGQVGQFNRPVILVLRSAPGGQDRFALLTGSSKQAVRVRFQERAYVLKHNELARLWQGQFMAVFRLPAEIPQSLQRGDAGPATAWVAGQLARYDNGPTHAQGPSFYDAALEARVLNLQKGFGLVADGIVGPDTLFALASLDADGPHLARTTQE
ncbi:MAG: AAA family ATPase [Rhodanobacteraceae bacterium]